MQVGDLVRVPTWQLKRAYWYSHRNFGTGFVFKVTPHTVYVRWSNGECFPYKTRTSECLEVINEGR